MNFPKIEIDFPEQNIVSDELNILLENIDEEYVQISGKRRLVRKTSITRGSINTDNIKKSLLTGLAKTNINIDDIKLSNLINNLLDSVEENRPKKERKYIKRMKEVTDKKNKKHKKNSIDAENINYD